MSRLEPLTSSPATSLLEHVLAHTGASRKRPCLGSFRRSGGVALSVAYHCVLARLQYMCSRQFVLRMRYAASARG